MLLLGHHDIAREELVKYLSCKADGSLEKFADPQVLVRPVSVPIIAHYLLRLVDSLDECPYLLPLPEEWKRKTYARVLCKYKEDVPKELVEYLFEEFPCFAWDLFRNHEEAENALGSSKLTLKEVEFVTHLIETTA